MPTSSPEMYLKVISSWFNSKLGLDQVRQLGLNKPLVELLVISACRSAYGNREAELGFGGLAVQAGVKSALASLLVRGRHRNPGADDRVL